MGRDQVPAARQVSRVLPGFLCLRRQNKLMQVCRNCNTFTDELLWRLTGRRAPGWINRAAWVRSFVRCSWTGTSF